jgi:hypothetical protein
MARNYGRLVQQLRSERLALEREVERLSRAIEALEGGTGRGTAGSRKAAGRGGRGKRRRRGRMSPAARKAVSLRMKKYWAAKRKATEGK